MKQTANARLFIMIGAQMCIRDRLWTAGARMRRRFLFDAFRIMSLPLADWPQQAPDLGIAGLRLRPLRDTDAAAWYAYLSDDNVTRHTSWQLDGADALAGLIRGYADPVASHALRLAIVEADEDVYKRQAKRITIMSQKPR